MKRLAMQKIKDAVRIYIVRPSTHLIITTCEHLLLLAPSHADIHVLSKVGRDSLPELLNVLSIDGVGETKGGVNDVGIQSEEALRNLVGTGVFGVQSSDEGSLLAVVVELEMDGALRKDSAFELVEGTGDFLVLSSLDEAVFEHVAELEV